MALEDEDSSASATVDKAWPSEYSTRREFSPFYNGPSFERWRELELDGDELDMFLDDLPQIPRLQAEEIRSYCRPTLSNCYSRINFHTERPPWPESYGGLAWVDDRTDPPGNESACARRCRTPAQLDEALKNQRLPDSNGPDAARRLIYLKGLHPEHIRVLAGTATFCQIEGLRNAIYRYIASEAFVGVETRPADWRPGWFNLEFHLPVFLIRSKDSLRETTNEYPQRRWRDVSFLSHEGDQEKFSICKAQISCLVAGRDEWNWTAYAFVDPHLDDEIYLDTDELDEDLGYEDPISAGNLDGCSPLWNPREYFLAIFSFRIMQIQREWDDVARELERRIDRYKQDHPLSLSEYTESTTARLSYDWTLLVMTLLDELLTALVKSNRSWDIFYFQDDGNAYFRDLKGAEPLRSLQNIKRCFGKLERCRENLQNLKETVTSYSRALERILEINSNSSWLRHMPLFNGLKIGTFMFPQTSPLYNQLSFHNSEIRLLKFTAPWTGATLAFTLVVVPLPKSPKYVALSYNWGQHTRTVTIRLNNFVVPITTNLYDALRRIRAGGAQYVWADALCINQQDPDERSVQVQRMRAIFQKASRVAVWLGPEARVNKTGLQLQADTTYVDLDHQPDLVSSVVLRDLLSRPYWERVWIIQEVAVASDVVVYFGRYSISWEEFVNCCRLYARDATISSRRLSNSSPSGLATLLQFRDDKKTGKHVSFSEAIRRSRSSLSTDPRDKLFALLGLSFNGKDLIPEPNYINSPEEVFIEFTAALIKSYAPLDYIYLKAAHRTVGEDLPSWVPDWTKLDDVITQRQFDYIIQLPQRELELGGISVFSLSEATLTVKGMIVDTVHYLGNILVGQNGDIEAPDTATWPDVPELNLGSDATVLIFKTLTGVGLRSERNWDNLDVYYVEADESCSTDEGEESELSSSLENTSELLAPIHAWLAANCMARLGARSLGNWWKRLIAEASHIGDVPRVSRHVHDCIRCGMRLLVTARGYVGWAHPQAQKGDKIARVYGCSRYVLLRAFRGKYRVVGDVIITDVEIGNPTYEAYMSRELQIL